MAAKKGVVDPGRYWVLLLAALQGVSVYGTELSSEACRELGFSSNLLCSSCDLLSQFGLSELDPFCKKCCQEEAVPEMKKLYIGLGGCSILFGITGFVSAFVGPNKEMVVFNGTDNLR
uniref:Uncharacterized protein n=1 Tax=Sphaerodactylus townsendi TaxID=933632 RepID=A0ACB8F3D3_9SAUR